MHHAKKAPVIVREAYTLLTWSVTSTIARTTILPNYNTEGTIYPFPKDATKCLLQLMLQVSKFTFTYILHSKEKK